MTLHSSLRWLSIAGALFIFILVALLAILLLFQPTLDLRPFKHLLERQLTDIIGVPIALGELFVKTSLEPSVEVRELRVADLARIEKLQLRIELVPLLKGRISIESLKLDEVTGELRPLLDLVKDLTGENDRPKSPYEVEAMANLEFDRVQLNVTDSEGDDHRLVIDELDGGVTRSSPLKLTARGSVDGVALGLAATGPTLEEAFSPGTPLPLFMNLDIADARLSVEGDVETRPGPPSWSLDFELRGDDLNASLAQAEIRAPELGPFRLAGSLRQSGGPVALSGLEGQLGGVELSGNLKLSFESERLALEGSLHTGRIDLLPWLESIAASEEATGGEMEERVQTFDRPLPVTTIHSVLSAVNVDLTLVIDAIDGLAMSLEGFEGQLALHRGSLALDYEARLAEAPIDGRLEIESPPGRLDFATELSATTLPLDQLSNDLGQGLTSGAIGSLRISAASSGLTLGELLHQLVFELESDNTQIRLRRPDNSAQVDFVLTHLEARRAPGEPVQVMIDGDLRDYPFRIELTGQATRHWTRGDPWPFTLAAEGLGSRTRLEGRLSLEPDDLLLELTLAVTGDRIGDLEPWWGVPARVGLPYEVLGTLIVAPDRRELHLDTLRVGRTNATMTVQGPQDKMAPIGVDLRASTVALDEWMLWLDPEDDRLATQPVLTLDIPIWPGELPLPDSKAHIVLDQVIRDAETLADLSGVVVDVEIHQSHLKRLAFSAGADDATLRGDLDLDWETDPPEMELVLAGRDIDLGRLLPLEEIAPQLVVRAKRFDLDITAAAETLRQMMREGVTISGRAEEVFISTLLLDQDEPVELTLNQAVISESPGRPIHVRADGHLRERPVELQIDLYNKHRTGPEDNRLPVEMVLRAGDVRLESNATLTLPVAPENLDLGFSLTADRFSSFEPFIGFRISDAGPVATTGRITLRPEGFDLRELSLEVGTSDLEGSISLRRAGARPRLAADLSSQRVDLVELFAHSRAAEHEPVEPDQGSDAPEDESAGKTWLETLQSSGIADLDLDLSLQADHIYWGSETGGGGEIRIRAEDGRLTIGPFYLILADGRVEGNALVQTDSDRVDADLELRVYDVEYGPIVRYLDPESRGDGEVDLEARLVTSNAPASQLVSAADGEFRFAIFPRGIDTTLLNFWGAGLFSSMFRVVDPTDESVLNCMAGDFSITQGQMTANKFWFDTSRVRARGKGSVDLTAGTVDMTLRPRPKKRTFLTLATPTRVRGPIEKPKISLTKGGLVGTAFRLYMWWLTVYTQVLRKPLPTDGSDVCILPPPPEPVDSPLGEANPAPNN